MDVRFLAIAAMLAVLPLQASDRLNRLPLTFEKNQGQADAAIRFFARGPRATLFLTSREAVIGSLRFSFPRAAEIAGVAEQAARSNYFISDDRARWRMNVPHFARVEYRGLYSGVNLTFYGNPQDLEYDFTVAPHADPRRIAMRLRGGRAAIDAAGDLVIDARGEQVRMKRPVAYQERDGRRQSVEARFHLRGQRISFQVGHYDRALPLVIDPVLTYSTYSGGGQDSGLAVTTDAAGNIYLAGSTQSKVFPTANAIQASLRGFESAFVAKLDPTGTKLLYSTYLGGSGQDQARSIAVDAQGNAYITGRTMFSPDFPIVNALQPSPFNPWTAFVAKLSADGSHLVYSTYLGGSSIDEGWGIAVDATGNAYVTGQTISKDFPTVNAVQAHPGGGPSCVNFCDNDAFVSMISADGSHLVYSTYLGGNDNDIGYGIAVDAAGSASIVGETASMSFPTVHAIQTALRGRIDAFVARLSPGGKSIVYSTYLGGSGDDSGRAIAVDSAGNAYVTGGTASSDFPVVSAVQPAVQATFGGGVNAFVSKVAPGGSLVYSTYLGGSLPKTPYINPGPIPEGGSGIAVDRFGNAYVTGQTVSIDFPLIRPLDVAQPKGVAHSIDGGVTWTGSGTGLSGALALGGSLLIDGRNPSTLYLATQGGVFKSIDSGLHWNVTGLRSPVNALPIGTLPVNALAIDQYAAIVYAGTPAGFATSSDGGLTWSVDATPGAVLSVAVDPSTPGVVYRGGLVTLQRSADYGVTWTSIYAGLPTTQCGDSPSSCISTSVIAITVDAPSGSIYAAMRGTSIGPLPEFVYARPLYKYSGNVWRAASNGLPAAEVRNIALDPANSNLVFASTAMGLYRSTDAASTWTLTSITAPAQAVFVDPRTHAAYAAVRGGVMRSSDGGVTWTPTGLNRTTVNALQIDTLAPNGLYAVADSGADVFVTEINSRGSAIVYSTTLGGSNSEGGSAIALDASGNVVVTGTTTSSDFPLVAALQSTFPAGLAQPAGVFTSKISASCPAPEPTLKYSLAAGFYIAEFTSAPGTSEGDWGSTIQVPQSVLPGGFNFGGGLEENGGSPAYGAFTVTDAQTVTINVQAEAMASGAPLAIQARLLDAQRQPVGTPVSAAGTLQFTAMLTPGFYILEVRGGGGSPRGVFQATVHATAVVGGIAAGSFLAAGETGYGAFYVQQAQDISVQTFGASTGAWAAGCLQVRLLDSNRTVVAPKP